MTSGRQNSLNFRDKIQWLDRGAGVRGHGSWFSLVQKAFNERFEARELPRLSWARMSCHRCAEPGEWGGMSWFYRREFDSHRGNVFLSVMDHLRRSMKRRERVFSVPPRRARLGPRVPREGRASVPSGIPRASGGYSSRDFRRPELQND
ncbi:hypothetical protein C8J56DRAFT_899106 [Mycena floridula]|nr:hypothetical protein C8J56DRAFT_899106 [Mycena floridula]